MRPGEEESRPYFEWVNDYAHILYPALIVLVVLLVGFGILAALRTEDVAGLRKADIRRRLLVELRQQVQGCSAEHLARVVDIQSLRVVKILEELQRDGIVTSYTSSDRRTTWQLKGTAPTGKVR